MPPARHSSRRVPSSDPLVPVTARRCVRWARPTAASAQIRPNSGVGLIEPSRVRRRELTERPLVDGREHQHVRHPRWRLDEQSRFGRGFQHHVCIGPAEPERAHSGHAPAGRPRAPRRHHLHRQRRPRDVRARRVKVQVSRNLSVLERQDRLDEPGDARGRLQMPDVGLHGAEQELALRLSCRPQRRRECVHLDRIAERRCRFRGPPRRPPRGAPRRCRSAPGGSPPAARRRSGP